VKNGRLCDVDALYAGSINDLHSGFGNFAKCVSHTEILVGLRKLVEQDLICFTDCW
jgi:hypothetical protein